MSARSNPVPINKTPSSESVCKYKEDRIRNNGNSCKYKQRNDNGNSSKHVGNYSNQANKKGQVNYQKQPRSRSVWGGKRTKVTSEQREEMGGKKVNMQQVHHLLNFNYGHEERFHSSGKVGFHSKNIAKNTFYNKEQFIQANCQLVLNESGNCDHQHANIDLSVEWDDVETVNIWREEIPTCPICLSDFCAARMTKCGHIYCWPCILHYLALDEKSWRKCPICHDAVHKKDLKSVTVRKERSMKVQSLITMQLMKRERGSNYAIPAQQEFEDNYSFKYDSKIDASKRRNANYLLASPTQILEDVVQVEKNQLEFKLATESDDFEKTFIKSALELCDERAAALKKSVDSVKKEDKSSALQKKSMEADVGVDAESPTVGNFSDIQNIDELKCTEPENESDTLNEAASNASTKNESVVYFYQASDGQHIYLQPLNFRCLIEQYGSHSHCPAKISARILESEEFSINEETRNRYRFLANLPLSLEFRLVELDLRPPLISAEVLAKFQAQLDRRAGNRRKKVRDEKRILRKAQNEAMKKQGKKYPAARICLENQQQFPQIQQQQTPGASYSVLFPSPGSTPRNDSVMPSTSAVDPSSDGSLASSCSESSLSFAQMLKTSGSDEQVAWGRRAPLPVAASIAEKGAGSDEDNFAAPPAYQASFGDSLCAALESMAPPSGTTSSGKSKKGKKAKKKVLFSTSGPHH